MSELEGFKELVADLIWMSQRYSVEPNVRMSTTAPSLFLSLILFILQTPLWVCGQKAREIVVVLDGQLDISMVDETDPSRSTPVDEMGPGDLCGEFECLLLHKHVTDCKTKTAVDLLVLDVKV